MSQVNVDLQFVQFYKSELATIEHSGIAVERCERRR